MGGGASLIGAVLGRLVLPPSDSGAFVLRLERLPSTLRAMAQDVTSLAPRDVVVLTVAAVLLALAWRAPLPNPARRALRLWLTGNLATLAAIAATADLVQSLWPRYLLWPVLSARLAAVLALPWGKRDWFAAAFSGVMLTALAPAAWAVGTALHTPAQPPPWPMETARCVDALAEREQASAVLSDYWHAKPLTLFSATGVEVMSFQPDLRAPRVWITSRAWYAHPERGGLVVADGLEGRAVLAKLGPPQERVACPPLTVLVYRGAAREVLRQFLAAETLNAGR